MSEPNDRRMNEDVELTEIDRAWAAVAKRRIDELRSGAVKGVSIEDVFEQAEEMIRSIREWRSQE